MAKTKICALSKLSLLKYAHQKGMRCYPRVKGRIVDKKVRADATPQQRAFAPIALTNEQVFCCGRKLGRHRRSGRRRTKRWDWRRAYRAHASYHRPRRRR